MRDGLDTLQRNVRIGFENSLWNRDGSVAADNAERVRELVNILGDIHTPSRDPS